MYHKSLFNQHYLQVLSPVYIGSGDTLSPGTYRQEDDRVYIYREDDLFKSVDSIDHLLNIKTSHITIERIISLDKIKQLTPAQKLHAWEQGIQFDRQVTELFMHEGQTRFIPGSSIKGSILHAIRRHNRALERPFSESFAIADAYFEEHYSTLQRGVRVTSKKSPSQQKQDNLKEWIVQGRTEAIKAHFRKSDTRLDEKLILEAIQAHTEAYLVYQFTYIAYLVSHYDDLNLPIKAHELEFILELIEWYRGQNEKDSPLIILGSNTHRFSKTLELEKKPQYSFTYDSDLHPLSRLLIREEDGHFTLPGMVKLVKA